MLAQERGRWQFLRHLNWCKKGTNSKFPFYIGVRLIEMSIYRERLYAKSVLLVVLLSM